MAVAPQIITETDPDDGQGGYSQLSGENVRLPDSPSDRGIQNMPPYQPQQRAQEPQPRFEIVETDDDFRPLDEPADAGAAQQPAEPAQPQPPQRDTRLAEDAQGGEALLDQQGRRPVNQNTRARQRQREGRDRTVAENQRLRQRLDEVEGFIQTIAPRVDAIDQGRHQQQIAELTRDIATVEDARVRTDQRIAEAVAAQDGSTFAAALRERDNLVMKSAQLQTRRNMLATGSPTGVAEDRALFAPAGTQVAPQGYQPLPAAPQQQFRQPPPEVVRNVRDFRDRHDWYDAMSKVPHDIDSMIVRQIDIDVANRGFDPRGQDYWDEVEDQMRRYLPHRFGDEVEPRQAQQPVAPQRRNGVAPAARPENPQLRGPRVGGGSERPAAPQNGNGTRVFLSPARKEAMIITGALDRNGQVADRPKFNRQMKAYAEFDRENGIGRQQ